MSTVLETASALDLKRDRHAFNLAVWDRLVADPSLAALDYRFETDEHGQIIMSPPAAPGHGNRQIEIGAVLRSGQIEGKVIAECPISTRKGVKAADVAWCSMKVWARSENQSCLVGAPEICVEIRSPSNTNSEIEEKKTLYFDAGAEEVWICELDGAMSFFSSSDPDVKIPASSRFPDFPQIIE